MNAPLDYEKLAHILGRLGSSFDGEVLAAARQAERVRAASGMTWQQIIIVPPRSVPQPVVLSNNDLLNFVRSRPDLLTQWELDFVRSLRSARYSFTPRQVEILNELAAKVRAAGRAAA